MLKQNKKLMKLWSWLLCVAMVISLMPQFSLTTNAATWSYPKDDPDFFEGEGSEEKPYLIQNAQQLANLSYWVNETTDIFAGLYFALTDDIDLGGKKWTPIGGQKKGDDNDFFACFDGKGHTIKGLYVSSSSKQQGLFGCVTSGMVKNLAVEGNVSGGNDTGGIVGYNAGTIEGCSFSGTVNGQTHVGGIAGRNERYVKNCVNKGNVNTTSMEAGGVVGYHNATVGYVTDCYNVGAVSGTRNGAIVGSTKYDSISGCYYLNGTADKGVGYHYYSREIETYAKTEEELKKVRTFVGWDFDKAWKMTAAGPVPRALPGEEVVAEPTVTVASLYGTIIEGEQGPEPDPDSFVISDTPVAGKELIAKFVSDGDYEIQEEDLNIGMAFNNVNVSAGKSTLTVLPNGWEMSGDSVVSFGNMIMTSSADNFPAYDGALEANAISGFYSAYPYCDRTVNGQTDRRKLYNCTVTGEYTAAGQIHANILTVSVDATLTLDSFRFWDEQKNDWDTETSGGTFNGNKLILNGTIKTNAATKEENPPLIEIYEHGSVIVGRKGKFVPCAGTELVLDDYATIDNLALFQKKWDEDQEKDILVSHTPSAKHGKEEYEWSTADNCWIAMDNFVDNESVLLYYDEFLDENGEAQAKVYVNGVFVEDWGTTEFVTGQAMTVKLRPSAERKDCVPAVCICSVLNGEYKEWNTWERTITLQENQTEGGYDFTFTPPSDKALYINVWWSEYDRVTADIDNFALETKVMDLDDNGTPIGTILVEGDPLKMVKEPWHEGHEKRLYPRNYFESGATIKLTFVPAGGYRMMNVESDISGNYAFYAPKATKTFEEYSFEESGFTDNGDGTYSYVITGLPEGKSILEFRFYCQEIPGGIQVQTNGIQTWYLVGETGEYQELTEEKNYRVSQSEIGNADQVTLKMAPKQDQTLYGLEISWLVGNQEQGGRFALSENNTYTIYKQDAWKDYSVDLLTDKVPLNNQYYVNPRDMATLTFSDDRQVKTNYGFTVGTPIEFTLEEDIYKVIVNPAMGESEEITVNSKNFSYTPTTEQGLWFDVYTSADKYDFINYGPNDEDEYCLRYSTHKLNVEGGEGSGNVSVDKDPVRSKTVEDDTKLIYNYETVKKVTLTIMPDAGSTYVIREDNIDITESVMENGNVYVWDVSGDDSDTPCVDIDFMPVSYAVEVQGGGTANHAQAYKGQLIDLSAGEAPEGKAFDKWEVVSGGVSIDNVSAENTTFVMGVQAVVIKVLWKDLQTKDPVLMKSALAAFEGKIGVVFRMELPDYVKDDPNAYAIFTKNGKESKMLVSEAVPEVEDGKTLYRFTKYVVAKEYRDNVNIKLFDGNGNPITIKGKSGTDYTTTGVDYSLERYVSKKKTTEDAKMAALAIALEDYCTAAQIYFGYNADGLTVSDRVKAVTNDQLAGYKGVFEGSMPEGLENRSISVAFEADNTFKLIYTFSTNVDPRSFAYTIDTMAATLQEAGGEYFLMKSNVAAKNLDKVYAYTITKGDVSYTVKSSVLTYARSSVLNGNEARKNLGRSLYLYNQAAKAYFGE